MKITKVYTRTGDQGETSIIGGIRVKKSCERLEAYGTVDELSSHLGLLAVLLPQGDDRSMITRIQKNLFVVCTNLATDQTQTALSDTARLPKEEIELLEQEVDKIMSLLPERHGFILPGGTQAAAQAHVCERRIVALKELAPISPETQCYINRLSDYLFVLAKKINFNANVSEIIW